jgi:hypothetical protein
VTLIGDDKRILKKVLKEGEGYERPNDGAVVRGVWQWHNAKILARPPGSLFPEKNYADRVAYLTCSEADWKVGGRHCVRQERT